MILVLALDAFDPDLATRFEAEGRLPTLSALRRGGLGGRLRSTFPPVSIPAWSTFLTGVGPGRHGLFDFTRLEGDRVRFQNAGDRGVPGILELADAAGRRVASLGIPGTYPAPRLRHGAVLSGFDSPLASRPDARGMHPFELWRSLADAGLDLRTSTLPEGRKGRGWHRRAARSIAASIDRRVEQARALLRHGPWDLLLVHFQAADTAGHHFFRYFDPASPRYAAGFRDRARVIPEVYERLDAAVASLLDACPRSTRCVILSDHGMGPASDCVIHLNRWLEERGYLVRKPGSAGLGASVLRQSALRWLPPWLQAPLFRRLRGGLVARVEARVRVAGLDLERSAAFSEESSTLPGVWVRDSSRLDGLIRDLRAWEAVERVYRREDLYRGPLRSRAPQLVLELRHSLVRTPPGYRGPALRRLAPGELDGERGSGLNGTHRPDGILLASGWPGVAGCEVSGVGIGDLAPSLLGALGVAIPAWMEGQPLPAFAPEPRFTEMPELDLPPLPDARMTQPEQARVERRLRALGYLG